MENTVGISQNIKNRATCDLPAHKKEESHVLKSPPHCSSDHRGQAQNL